jgi:hypothetical protein
MYRAGAGVLLCTSLVWAGTSSLPQPSVLVITNANVVDTRYGGVHPNMTITLKDGVIAAVTKIALIEPVAEVRVINASGAFVIPGLWDMSARLGKTPPGSRAGDAISRLYLANGVTGVRDLDSDSVVSGPAARGFQLELEPVRPPWLKAQTVSNGDWSSTQRIIDGLAPILRACAGVGAGAVDTISPPQCSGKGARQLFEELSKADLWVVPGLVSRAEQVAEPMPGAQNHTAHRSNNAGFLGGDQLVSDMHRAGVRFLTGTNQSFGDVSSWIPVQRELELLVESGLTPLEALQAATYNAATYMAKLNRFGVVEANHAADLVLLSKDPLQDIRNASQVQAVVLRGTYLSRSDLDRLLISAEYGFQDSGKRPRH